MPSTKLVCHKYFRI